MIHFQLNIEMQIDFRPRDVILGIETTCDDTGCAIVDSSKTILGQSLYSQEEFHLRSGGINPPVAQHFHRKNIERAVAEALENAKMTMNDIDAIAVANRPGLILSILVGLRYGKHLARKYSKPLIPIHHMEAHALTARIDNEIEFPFICLLASGGHCLLAAVKGVNEFQLLGDLTDDAPGECFDKVARALRFQNMEEFKGVNGGKAIEIAALRSTDSDRFVFPLPMKQHRNCQFSFSGMKTAAINNIKNVLNEANIAPHEPIPHYEDLCAGLLKMMTKHLLQRTQRAIEFCIEKNVFGDRPVKNFVFSGGVACNDFIFRGLEQLVSEYGYTCHRPAKELCRDNGVMIAWNGMERWLANRNDYINTDIDAIMPYPKCPFEFSLKEEVKEAHILPNWKKIPIIRQKALSL